MRVINHAFTVVEMLAVVAILTLLISLLMPSLIRSREYAKTVKCAAHLRQVHVAGMNYAVPNRGYLPTGAGIVPGSWSPTWDQLLQPYGTINDLIICPSHSRGTRHYWTNANYINAYKNWGDTRQTGVMSLGFSVRTGSLDSPSATVSWMELRDHDASFAYGGRSEPGSGWASISWDYQDYFIISYVHLNRANFAYCDGHVETHTEADALGPKDAGGNYSLYRFARKK